MKKSSFFISVWQTQTIHSTLNHNELSRRKAIMPILSRRTATTR